MKRPFGSLLLSLLAVPCALAAPAAVPDLQLMRAAGLPPAAVPASPAPQGAGYDLSGLPAYIFTDEDRLAAPLVAAMDRTRHTLDVALYNLQIDDAAAALARAQRRGVKVRVLFDRAHVYPQAGRQIQAVLDAGIEAREMNGRGGAMHCKFAVFDGTLLETGSANWSGFAETMSYENIMFTADPDFVSGYAADFEWMWAQARPVGRPDAPAARPSAPPSDPTPDVAFNGVTLPDYVFSPRGGTEAAIAKAVDAARSEIDVAMFTFTSKNIMEALKRAAARGVSVKLMLFSGQKFPFFREAKAARMELRFKDGRSEKGQMHNKFAVLDGKLLINGSFNWTVTAENANTENTVFTTEPAYVAPYKAEFKKLFGTAKVP